MRIIAAAGIRADRPFRNRSFSGVSHRPRVVGTNRGRFGGPGLPWEAKNTLANRRGEVVGCDLCNTLRIDLGFFSSDHLELLAIRIRDS